MLGTDSRMTLSEHLGELRKRLFRCVIAILVLGVVALLFARPIFALLMRPVLHALPPTQRSLIYTSGIEELNVLMKVGLYAGIFLSTPVILWQLWGFVAPGLYPRELRYATPFVLLGSLAFLTGALFCYLVLLPTMFRFLLNDSQAAATRGRVEGGQAREAEVLRLVRIGELERAADVAQASQSRLTASGDGSVPASPGSVEGAVDMISRMDALGRLIDATRDGLGATAFPALRQVMERRLEALEASQAGNGARASELLEQSASLLAGAAGPHGPELARIWKLEKVLSVGQEQLATEGWTRPLLTMSEQLSLVLMLLLALGVIFELPLVMALLATLGVVKASFLMKYQRHAFVVCLIAAAVITPTGDAVNLGLMAGPMVLCYELGVVAAWLIEKRKARDAAETAITPT